MPTRKQEMQYLIRSYRELTGKQSVDMHDVAKYAVSKGWPLPSPKTALDRLAEFCSSAAREEIRTDEVTGHPYHANIAVTTWQGTEQLVLWTDLDQAPRPVAQKNLIQRREQTVGDVLRATFDKEHWNRINPTEEPLTFPLDFTDDVEWRKNAPDESDKKANG